MSKQIAATEREQFLNWFRAVTPYIHQHKGKTFVVCLTSEIFHTPSFKNLVYDLNLLRSLGIQLVLIYGANQLFAHDTIFSNHQPLRVDATGLQSTKNASGDIYYQIQAAFSQGLPNTPMSGAEVKLISGNYITASPRGTIHGIDSQYAGKVRKVDTKSIKQALSDNHIVVIPPFGYSPTGEMFVLNEKTLASEVATHLHAEKLIYLVPLTQIPKGEKEWHDKSAFSPGQIQRFIEAMDSNLAESQIIKDYLLISAQACQNGVERCHVLPYSEDGSLLLEIYTHFGVGLMVIDDAISHIREATIEDVGSIINLLQPFEDEGILVKRDRNDIEQSIHQFSVLDYDGVLLATAMLDIYPLDKTAELACFSVAKPIQGLGEGEKILQHIEKRAKEAGLTSLFVLTTQTTHWFLKHGFHFVEIDWLPLSRKKKYNPLRASKVMVKTIA